MKKSRLLKKESLLELLQIMINAIKNDDTFEGRVSYTNMNPEEHEYEDLKEGDFEVNAFIRIGNKMGQGTVVTTIN